MSATLRASANALTSLASVYVSLERGPKDRRLAANQPSLVTPASEIMVEMGAVWPESSVGAPAGAVSSR